VGARYFLCGGHSLKLEIRLHYPDHLEKVSAPAFGAADEEQRLLSQATSQLTSGTSANRP
jgi:hypothetical protein